MVLIFSAQNATSYSTLVRIEKLLLHHKIEAADSLFQQEQLNYGTSHSLYCKDNAKLYQIIIRKEPI